jgi:NADH:ubiquinone oxidoreductase subunit 3 (subunit A)
MPDSNIYGNLANQFPDIASLTSNSLVSNNPSLVTLKTNTNNLQTNLNTIQGQSNAAISKQQDMQTIVEQEQSRLEEKKSSIDNAYSSQQRAIYMNDNTQKRYNAYSRILFIVVIILFIIFALILIQPYLLFIIPSIIFNVVIIGLASFMIIYCLGIYFEIERHEKIDYDRYYNKRLTAGLGDTSNNYDNSFNYDTSFSFCANSSCCAPGTFFDTTIHQCSPGNPPGFKQGFQNIADNSPYEYSEYSKY